MKQKLFRGIVMLFLVYTAVEFAFPQLCGERAMALVGSRSVAHATGESLEATFPESPRPDNDVPDDDDCFCCCAHVMPSPLFVNPETATLSPADLQHSVSIPTASLGAPYHPPRSA